MERGEKPRKSQQSVILQGRRLIVINRVLDMQKLDLNDEFMKHKAEGSKPEK
jgi:hypothetical protein